MGPAGDAWTGLARGGDPTREHRNRGISGGRNSATSTTRTREQGDLRSSPEHAAEYARVKWALAAADDRDRPRYRAGKAPFIVSVLRRTW